MTKTDSYANHCTKANEHMNNEQELTSVSQPVIKLQKSAIDGLEDSLSSSDSAGGNSSQSDDLTPQPTASGNNFENQHDHILTDKLHPSMQRTMSSPSDTLSCAYSIMNSLLMKAYEHTPFHYLSNQSEVVTKPKVQTQTKLLSSQFTYAREVPSAAAIKPKESIRSSTIIQRNSSETELFDSSKTSSGDSFTENLPTNSSNELNVDNHLLSNGENDRKSLYDELPVAAPSIVLNEPQTIFFPPENYEDLQDIQEITTSVDETHTLAESPWITLDESYKSVEPTASENVIQPQSTRLDADRNNVIVISNALHSKNVTSGHEESHLLQPVKLSYDQTNTNNKLAKTSTLNLPTKSNQPNLSFPDKAQSDDFNGLIPLSVTTEHSYCQPIQNDVHNFATPQLPVQPKARKPFKHPIYIQPVQDAVKSTASGVNSSKKIIILSNEMVKLPPVGSLIRIKPNDHGRIQPNQIHLTSKAGGKAVPIKMAPKSILKRSTKVAPISTPPTTTLKRKRSAEIGPYSTSATTTTLKRMRPTEIESNSTPATTTTLKRKNNENVFPVTPSKVQKLERPLQVTMTKNHSCSTLTLPQISIQRFGTVGGVKKSDSVGGVNITLNSEHSSKNKSLSDCLEFLRKNNVSIFKLPQKPCNKTLEKYKKMFEKNNVQVSKVNNNR